MTDDDLYVTERDALDGGLHPRQVLRLIAEVRRLRAIEATSVQKVAMAAQAIERLDAAERLAEATIENQDAWADATHDAKRWMASCDAWRAAVDAYRKAKSA